MKKMQDMGGFFVAAVTPYDEQGRFSAPALHKLMDKTIAEGAKGFLIGGSSAECPLLTHEERVEGLQAAAQYKNREKTKLMASVAAISTDEAIEYAKTAKALGYDAMISTVPYYYKFGMKAISAYYGALREAVDLPLFLYNFPGNTGVELDIADDYIRGMLTDGTIAGVKQTSLNLYQMERIRDLNPELVIYGGFDEVYIGARILGAVQPNRGGVQRAGYPEDAGASEAREQHHAGARLLLAVPVHQAHPQDAGRGLRRLPKAVPDAHRGAESVHRARGQREYVRESSKGRVV